MNTLMVVTGPTAVGKSSYCMQLAKKWDTEIFSCDSRQFYREMKIGTAAPEADEMDLVPYHFIGNLSVKDQYTVYQYEKEVIAKLQERFKIHPLLLLTGGSGLYLDVVIRGMDDIPDPDPEIRNNLLKRWKNEGVDTLRKELLQLDPDYYQTIDLNNPKRILRGLEVCLTTGKPFSTFRAGRQSNRPFKILLVILDRPRDELYRRIDRRVDNMMEKGLLDEARSLYPLRHLNALNTVGYKELFGYFDGRYSLDEAIRLIRRNTRHYARRQLTWFRKYQDTGFFNPDKIRVLTLRIHPAAAE
ncbi:MAG: tRNA (adenosine(37)-N6)-dimethylallyltransferase MiaA [Bacteroidales bacterium]|nr:tRNA (adenosine(37)-N6)-dimethylallyltransferase MiaA [Bacteroidales bacterium]